MLNVVLSTYLLVAFAALLVHVALVLQAWEYRRFTRRRFQVEITGEFTTRVALIVPCKGVEAGLNGNLRSLLTQDHPNYEVIFVVDSPSDPAVEVIQEVLAEKALAQGRLLIAGRTTHCAQKVHNLRMATADLPRSVGTIAFADSDIQVEPHWLRTLVSDSSDPRVGATTSYRWMIPARATLGNFLLFSINSATMSLSDPRGRAPIWGGTWAISRDLFEKSGLRKKWSDAVTDDLTASEHINKLGLRVRFEPRCVPISSIDYPFWRIWEFLRRQLFIGRLYRPKQWQLCFAAVTASVVGFWGSVSFLAWALCSRPGYAWLPAIVLAVLYGFAALRAWWRQEAGLLYVRRTTAPLRAARIFDVCSFPLSALALWIGFFSSAIGSRIRWRGTEYHIGGDRQVTILHRQDDGRENRHPPKSPTRPNTLPLAAPKPLRWCRHCRAGSTPP
jgi:ceramide glucosyltransferase